MYCIHCGADGVAKFCASCGRPQNATAKPDPEPAFGSARAPVRIDESINWTKACDYEAVLHNDYARDRIAAASKRAGLGLNGDHLLEMFDAVSPLGIPLGKLTQVISPLYDKLGIRTDHQVQRLYEAPAGRVLLATLCVTASRSLTINAAEQTPDQCSMSIDLPLGLITNRAKLTVIIEKRDVNCQMTLRMTISGQWNDWGRSKRLTTKLFSEIAADLTHQNRGENLQPSAAAA